MSGESLAWATLVILVLVVAVSAVSFAFSVAAMRFQEAHLRALLSEREGGQG